jgi:acetyl-CoA synthetase
LKLYSILEGYRGRSTGDIEAIVDAVMSVSKMISENDISELDINPLLVMEDGNGVVAVDALIKLN